MERIFFFSPAKLNLFFHILGRRLDGYHEIASLVSMIDFGDVLSFAFSAHDCFTYSGLPVPCDASNLIVRALHAFREHTALPLKVSIHLDKKIPIQAGLGGGSSNAATVLWALNELTGKPCSLQTLKALGASLGSDVALFFSEGVAYCSGKGEIVENRTEPFSIQGWLAKPPFGLSTPSVYRSILSTDQRREPDGNDLEPAAMRIEPRLRSLKEYLHTLGFDRVGMSGSGTTFFCLGKQTPPKDPFDLLWIPFRSLSRTAGAWYAPQSRSCNMTFGLLTEHDITR